MNSKFYRGSSHVNNASKGCVILMEVQHLRMNFIVGISDRKYRSQYNIHNVLVVINAAINSHRKIDQIDRGNNENSFDGMGIIVPSTLSNRFG
jgi:hypothetical protein